MTTVCARRSGRCVSSMIDTQTIAHSIAAKERIVTEYLDNGEVEEEDEARVDGTVQQWRCGLFIFGRGSTRAMI